MQLGGGRYALGALLGHGGSARVYEAIDTTSGVTRAIKLLHTRERHRDYYRRRFLQEARVMWHLNHPHILRVHDFCADDDLDYIVMDLAEGGNMLQKLRQGALDRTTACRAGLQLLSALGVAHRAKVIHRDIKPSNLLLDASGHLLLADFGIARLTGPGHHNLTRTGATLGSFSFAAPEQRLDPQAVSPAADIYAVATTLYYLLSGANPTDLFTAAPDSPRWRRVSRPLRPVLQRATAYDPLRRQQSASAMCAELTAAVEALATRERSGLR